MNYKTYKQLEFEPYFENGVAKLRPKQELTKDPFLPDAHELLPIFAGLTQSKHLNL